MNKLALTALLLLVALGGAGAYVLETIGVAPRQLGPYIERRASGHRYDQVGVWVSNTLVALDRGDGVGALPALRVGAQPGTARTTGAGRIVAVASSEAALAAIAGATTGDVITLAPGTYRFAGRGYIPTGKAGGVTVRAEQPGTVFVELNMGEGFLVSSPHWTFQNLHIRGVCKQQANCEHAFHVVGGATHFVARNNTIMDFNAHFKINGNGDLFPDHGLIEGNTISNSTVRATYGPVTPVDLVAASHWTIRGNIISDFIKGAGDRISYGAFAKGGGSANRFERNVIVCEDRLRDARGQRVGLSLGGGGTGKAYCRDRRCVTEQDGGVIEANVIASCSDEGIYLNRAATSSVVHNTLVDTAGVSARWPETSADVHGNIVDGRIRERDGALLRAQDNLDSGIAGLFAGWHPQRALFAAPEAMDLRWRGDAPRREALVRPVADLCGTARPVRPAYGAFEDFAGCMAPRP